MKRLDLTGQRFGRLLVTGYGTSKVSAAGKKTAMWNVLCECGTSKQVSAGNLRHRSVESCGCRRKEGLNKKEYGVASFNSKLSIYKNGAKKRNLSFELTKEQFKEICQKPCVYCGSTNATEHQANHCNGPFISNGIDRVNSSLGYTIDNSVSCCSTCNRMKMDHSLDFFIEHMQKVLRHLRKV